jgi:carbonic anhydrase
MEKESRPLERFA